MTPADIHAVELGLVLSIGVLGIGLAALHLLRRLSIIWSIMLIAVLPLLALVMGVAVVSGFMFTEALRSSALVWLSVVLVTVPGAVLLGRSLARRSVWEREALERERAAERGRRELLAWLSHDLRTPITGVQVMTEALEDGVVSDPDDVAEYARMICSETMRLAAMIDDLFEMSQINAGTLAIEPEPVQLADVVESAVAVSVPVADRAGVRLVVEQVQPDVVALGAASELMRVVRNLLSNAIRHTPAGEEVRVSVGLEDHEVWLRVDDVCGGIPEADLDRVFDMGYRGTAAREADQSGGQGAGMGLAIARGLLDAQSGSVGVLNTGPGCRFEVRLPAS